jgi:two-component system chemotaxis sensor kinase CheA
MAGERALIYEFVSEAKEHLANLTDDLLALEQRKDDASRYRIDRMFRAVHSVKGGAGFFGCRTIETLAHALETVLERARETGEPPAPQGIDALLAGADRILALLDDVERSNDADVGELLSRLHGLTPAEAAAPPVAAGPALARTLSPGSLGERPSGHAHLHGVAIDLTACQHQGWSPLAVLRRLQEVGAILDARLDVPDADLEAELPSAGIVYQAVVSAALPADAFARALGLPGLRVFPLEQAEAVREPPLPPDALPSEEPPAAPAGPDRAQTLRVSVGLIDRLMTLAGELVLIRNQALRAIDPVDSVQRSVLQRLDGVTSELQDAVVRTRMQPVGNLFGKFPRLVRDLARQMGKQIELDVTGTEVELDKTILESLSDPLTHLIRNACDHGIEDSSQRERTGKPAVGRVSLAARHLGGQIHLEVRDDGKGIDPTAVKRKALEVGLRTPAELSRLGDKEVLSLILLPGFSTAREVTDLSGRGVGMDVVKTNLDRLGGVLEIDSDPGYGTTFTLRLPLTLAIIPCLIVAAGGERYAIPQKDLEELVCLHPRPAAEATQPVLGRAAGAATTTGAEATQPGTPGAPPERQQRRGRPRIEYAYDQEVVRLRDRLLPLVRLAEVLRRPAPFTAATRAEVLRQSRAQVRPPARGGNDGAPSSLAPVFFAVVKAGSQRFGLIVDAIRNTEEVVVKPMHSALRKLACFSGATIMGDGRVALILSIEGVARHAGVSYDVGADRSGPAPDEDRLTEAQTLLLFRSGPHEQFALPLAVVRRIEQVRMDRVEKVGEREFLPVEGVPTPVLRLDRLLDVSPCPDRAEMFLLLPRNPRRPVGLLLSAVIDTETLRVNLTPDSEAADGVLGSAVVRGRMTLFLDLYRLADRMAPSGRDEVPRDARRKRVLLVEDTQFFRQLVQGYLEANGYEVVTAVNGADGLQRLDAEAFDLVVSDVEMPVMDGVAFARALRQRPGGAVPLLALTTLDSDADRERILAAGFDRHEVKLDRERFIAAVAALLRARAPG